MKISVHKITFILLLFFWISTSFAYGQTSVLDQYVKEGLKNNQQLLEEILQLKKQNEIVKEANGLFMPDISFHASYSLANGGRGIQFPVGDLLNPVYAQLDIPTRLDNVNEQLLPDNFHETKIRLIQPLFNTDIFYNYQAQQHLVSAQEAKLEAYKNELVKEIKVGYFNYLNTLEVLTIYNNTQRLLQELLRVNEKLVANGQATKDVIYNAKFELSQLESLKAGAIKSQNKAAAYFNFIINRPLQEEITIDKTIGYQTANGDLSKNQDLALTQRNELKQLQQIIAANNTKVKSYQGNKLPKLTFVADIGYQGFEYKFDNNQDFWLVNFSLQWPLFKGFTNKSKIQQSKIQVHQLKNQYNMLENQIKLQVINNWYALEAAENAFQAQLQGLKSATENFKIVKRKYIEGQSLLVEYLDAQTKFTNTNLNVTLAKYQLIIKKIELDNVISNYQ